MTTDGNRSPDLPRVGDEVGDTARGGGDRRIRNIVRSRHPGERADERATAAAQCLPERPPEPAAADWSEVLFSAVWLVFLAFPVVSVINAPGSPAARALGLTGLGLFAVCYVLSWIREILLPGCGKLANCLLWCLILLLPLTLLLPLMTPGITFTAPFFLALCIFRLPLRESLVAAAVIGVLAYVSWLLLTGVAGWIVPVLSLGPAWLILLASRLAMERSMVNGDLKRELELARQRETVGRDVHDILGHSLTVISVKVQLAQRLLETDPGRARQELDDVLALSRESLADVRATVGKLRQPELSVQVVQARTALRSAGITPHVPSAVPPVFEQWRAAFAWILREAVTNVVRHSRAETCWITLTSRSLSITDDGVGLARARDGAAAASSSGGTGLDGMRERAEKAGLRLSVFSPVEGRTHGTRIVVGPQ